MSRPTIKALPIQFTGDRRIDAASQSVASANGALAATPIFTGRLLEGVRFTGSTPLDVAHGLGRRHLGWIVTRAIGNRVGLVETLLGPNDALYTLVIRLADQVALGSTVDLWVF